MSLTNLVGYFIETNQAKKVKRYSTCDETVRDTTASHSYHPTLMCACTIRELRLSLDVAHTLELALRHDSCEIGKEHDIESITVARGDITREQKKEIEKITIEELARNYGMEDDVFWREYEESATLESKFVKAMDKIECLIHLIERCGTRRTDEDDHDHVAKYADDAVRNFRELEPLLREVKSGLKRVYCQQKIPWKDEYNYPDNQK